eukprot:GHUV01034183.1.p1 GENE.GHUV01034183.1~~GHUV01034183.1.p1  ORF type:complete len:432 (+),score=154.97 GHUV01034183.1:2250-3545(+)
MTAAAAVGGEVHEASKLADKAFKEQRTVLLVAAKAKQPPPEQMQSILQPVAEPMMAASALADNRRSAVFQQNKVLAEALQALSWLAYTGPSCGMHTPAQHISESWNSAEFYANKLLKEFRGVDENQVNWVKGLKELYTALQKFVSANYPMGLKWNPSGTSNIAEAVAAATAASPAAATAPSAAVSKGPTPAVRATGAPKGPPPPAPPPPPGLKDMLLKERPGAAAAVSNGNSNGGPGGAGMADLLAALNKGSAVTSGLRKVTDDMKAKNRTDRSGVVPTGPAAAKPAAPRSASQAATGPPRFELEQERKWVIENQVGHQELIVNIKDPKQSVYIYNCSGSVVQVKGKCNAISVDKCKKTGVVYENVIAACEMVNCSSIQVQCTGAAPTMSIDKCDGVQLYIPAALAAHPDFQVRQAVLLSAVYPGCNCQEQ